MDGPVAWGWDERWGGVFARVEPRPLTPARVVAQHRGRWLLATTGGELGASISGRLRRATAADGLPAVGDWVGFVPADHAGDVAVDAVLPRRSAFRRRAAGSRVGSQIVAANVDTLLVASGLDGDLNPRRLERYVTMAREGGAEPVVVLTKADLVDAGQADAIAARLRRDLGVAVVPLSAHDGSGLDGIASWMAPGRTLALVGSSGVGKSTLLNRLAGLELMATRTVRADDCRGRHTTTHRELFRLPAGALLLDTPGMRELGLWDAAFALEQTFTDIAELAARCRFGDCRHELEPGCAVRDGVAWGTIDERRLRAFRRLLAETAEQPAPHERRASEKRFARAVRHASEDCQARKSWRSWEG